MTHDDEPTPLDSVPLRNLIDAERDRGPAPDAARDAAREKLAGLFPDAVARAAAPRRLPRLFTRGQLVATGASLFGLGVVVGAVATRPAPPASKAPDRPEAVTIVEARSEPPRAQLEPAPVASVRVATSVVPPTSRPPSSLTPPMPPTPPAASATTEDAWIDAAREALARGLATDALADTAEHARRYPDGALAEEREALAIQALVALGRRHEAGNRAGAFRKHWPDSLLRPSVDHALQ